MRGYLAYAVLRVPWYRARLDAYDPTDITSWRAFSRVPLLTKEALRSAAPLEILADGIDLKAGLADGSLEYLRTSGTSGERITVVADAHHNGVPREDLALWDLDANERLTRLAVLTSPECLGRACDGTYASRLRSGGSSIILPSTDEPLLMERELARAIVDDIARLDAGELFVSPVYLHALVRACRTFDIALPDVALILLSYQYTTHCQRRALTEAFPRARLYSFYGASELGGSTVALECKRGLMHAWPEQAHVEIVGDDGAPVAEGTRGRIVITAMGSWISPVIRYLIGDIGVLRRAPCDCPLKDAPVLDHHGREKDQLHIGARTFTTRDIDDAIGAPAGLDFWQLAEDDDGLVLRAVPALDARPSVDELAARVFACTGAAPRVKIVDVIDAEPSGKIAHTRPRAR